MKKRAIKVIKADAENAPPPAPTTKERRVQELKDKADGDREMAGTVNDWITERRKNSRAEKLDAHDSRVAWHEDKSKP
ncbi:MAG: hypothetical protein ACKVQJ_08030 [Pyrinomonadaceae bacterium]